jgi:hypothetical protein
MKALYDKILLAIAVLALLGGLSFFVLKSGSAPEGSSAPAVPTGGAYTPVPVPDSKQVDAAWPEPTEQSSGWVYDVFTPPRIFIDENGQFSAEGWAPPPPPQPFGIYLADIARQPYRIQIQGFSGDRTKPETCVLFLFDEERQSRFFIRTGERNAEAEIEVVDFVIDRSIDANNNVDLTAIATIVDERSGETVELVDGERLYESGVTLVFRSREDPGVRVEVDAVGSGAGSAFETPAGSFVLKEINHEADSVTVEKQANPETDAELRTLSLQPETPSEVTAPRGAPAAPSEPVDFDSIF